jgi:hypothetical protein
VGIPAGAGQTGTATVVVGGESWVVAGAGGPTLSEQQQAAAEEEALIPDLELSDFAGLPFEDSFSVAFPFAGGIFENVVFANSSSDTSYEFTSLALSTGLDGRSLPLRTLTHLRHLLRGCCFPTLSRKQGASS